VVVFLVDFSAQSRIRIGYSKVFQGLLNKECLSGHSLLDDHTFPELRHVKHHMHSSKLRSKLKLISHLLDPLHDRIRANIPWGQLPHDVDKRGDTFK
jgi:hypothetical protein